MGVEKQAPHYSDDQLLLELGREYTAVLAIGVIHSENTEAKLAEVERKEARKLTDLVGQEVGIVPIQRPTVRRPPPKVKKAGEKKP